MKFLTDAEWGTLRSVVREEGEPSLESLAEALGVSASLLSQRFSKLEKEGWVRRHAVTTGRGRIVRYAAEEGAEISWISPHDGIGLRWRCIGAIDWEFPLVSQVPDALARETLRAFLARLRDERLLDASRRWQETPGVRAHHAGLGLVAYGSTARGDSKPGSDVDLLVIEADPESLGGPFPRESVVSVQDRVIDLAAETSLASPRPIQVRVAEVQNALDLPPWIVDAIQKEGLVVHDGPRSSRRGTGFGLFKWVYGRRSLAESG